MTVTIRVAILMMVCVLPLGVRAAKSNQVKPLPAKTVPTLASEPETIPEDKPAQNRKEQVSAYLMELERKMVDQEEDEPLNLVDADKAEKDIPESQIPLAIGGSTKPTVGAISPFQKMVAAIGTLCLFGLVAMFFIFRKGKTGALNSGSRNIKVLARKPLGPKRELTLIKVAGETILIGVTDYSINMIKTLSILEDEMPQIANETFTEQLNRNLSVDFTQAPPTATPPQEEVVDGFAVSRLDQVRDIVAKRYINQ